MTKLVNQEQSYKIACDCHQKWGRRNLLMLSKRDWVVECRHLGQFLHPKALSHIFAKRGLVCLFLCFLICKKKKKILKRGKLRYEIWFIGLIVIMCFDTNLVQKMRRNKYLLIIRKPLHRSLCSLNLCTVLLMPWSSISLSLLFFLFLSLSCSFSLIIILVQSLFLKK